MEQTAQRNRAEWFFSEDGHRAYASSGTTGEKTRYFFEYLRGIGQKTPDRVLYKLAYIMADSMDAAGVSASPPNSQMICRSIRYR